VVGNEGIRFLTSAEERKRDARRTRSVRLKDELKARWRVKHALFSERIFLLSAIDGVYGKRSEEKKTAVL